ncbi:MAG: alpha/beta hydrolase [Gammaproteobacteria bacterium]
MSMKIRYSDNHYLALGRQVSFRNYINMCKKIIRARHPMLNYVDADTLIEHNAPFEFIPNTPYFKKGILMVHGLYESPYSMRELGDELKKKGFLVRSVLLPGHGTSPEQLNYVGIKEWLDAVKYGVQSLKKDVEEVYVLGFSIGATLALNTIIHDPAQIKGIILFAPLIKIKEKRAHLLPFVQMLQKLIPPFRWIQRGREINYVRYRSYSTKSAYEAYRMTKLLAKKNKKAISNIPLFMVGSYEDATIDFKAAEKFFKTNTNPISRMLVYTKDPDHIKQDTRIEARPSLYPESHISGFSHVSFLYSEENPYYGKSGSFLRLKKKIAQALSSNHKKPNGGFEFGENPIENFRKDSTIRLTYNPDFEYLTDSINQFLSSIK